MNIEFIERNTDLKVEYHETIGSTNERAKEIAEAIVHTNEINFDKIQIVIAEEQLKGKGTNGRVWLSNKGENILMTVIFYPQNSIKELQKITYSIAQMVQSSIKDLYDINLEIKLPNDLMLNNKKVCGILTESSIQNEQVKYLLIGIGLNIHQVNLPNELINIATSLKKEFPNVELNREEIIVKIINRVKSLVR